MKEVLYFVKRQIRELGSGNTGNKQHEEEGPSKGSFEGQELGL